MIWAAIAIALSTVPHAMGAAGHPSSPAQQLASLGTMLFPGEVVQERGVLLGRKDHKYLVGLANAGMTAEDEIAKLRRELAEAKRLHAASIESGAECLAMKAPVCPACECSEIWAAVAGAGVGAVACGGFWLGAEL